MRKFLVVHYNPIGEACLNLLAEQRTAATAYLADPRPASEFKSAIRKFKRLMITYFLGGNQQDNWDLSYHYVIVCGEETSFSKKVQGKRISPQALAEMFPGEWANALLRIQDAHPIPSAAG